MVQVIKPSAQSLRPLVAQAMKNTDAKGAVARYISAVNTVLMIDPKAYRSYGMYWYAIKQLLLEHGHTGFGELVELELVTNYGYPDPVHTCCAAWAYRMDRIKRGLQYRCEHQAPTQEDPDYCYQLEDPELELLILMRLYCRKGTTG